ncbi:hypothetical protein WDU94_015577, partial [Cyamophila willieti]
MVEKITKDVHEVASESVCERFDQSVSKSLEDPLIQNPTNVFQQHAIQFIRDMSASDRSSNLSQYLPKVMHYCQIVYTYNDLMDKEKGIREYFEFMATLVLEYWKSHFLQNKIHGLEREQKMVYVALTYLYRNEGAIMDLLLKLTFWIENSNKSQINMENLFNLIRIFYLKLIVKNPKYMSANFTNLSLLNYIRLFLLFKILKHLETEATLASNEVTVDLEIDPIIEDFAFHQPVHPELSHVLPLLDRVFPETDITRFKERVRQLLIMHEYNFFERISGFLDFQKQYASHIDLAGNMMFTFKKKRVNTKRNFTIKENENFIPPKKESYSRKFMKYASNKRHAIAETPRISLDKREQFYLNDNNENVVQKALDSNSLDQVNGLVERLIMESTSDITVKTVIKHNLPAHEETIDKTFRRPRPNPMFNSNSLLFPKRNVLSPHSFSKEATPGFCEPFAKKVESPTMSDRFQSPVSFESTRNSFGCSLSSMRSPSDSMLFSSFINNPSSCPSGFIQQRRPEIPVMFGTTLPVVEELSQRLEKIDLKEETLSVPHCILRPSRINNIDKQSSPFCSNVKTSHSTVVSKNNKVTFSNTTYRSIKERYSTTNPFTDTSTREPSPNNPFLSANFPTKLFTSESSTSNRQSGERLIRPKSFVELTNPSSLKSMSNHSTPDVRIEPPAPEMKDGTSKTIRHEHESLDLSRIFSSNKSNTPSTVLLEASNLVKPLATKSHTVNSTLLETEASRVTLKDPVSISQDLSKTLAPLESREKEAEEADATGDTLEDVEELMEVIEEVVVGMDEALTDSLLDEVEPYRPASVSETTYTKLTSNKGNENDQNKRCNAENQVHDYLKDNDQNIANPVGHMLVNDKQVTSTSIKGDHCYQLKTSNILVESIPAVSNETTTQNDNLSVVEQNQESIIAHNQVQSIPIVPEYQEVGSAVVTESIVESILTEPLKDTSIQSTDINEYSTLPARRPSDPVEQNVNQLNKTTILDNMSNSCSLVNETSNVLQISSSVENIVSEIVKVAENMEKTDYLNPDESRTSELSNFESEDDQCTSSMLGQEENNTYAEIEPDDFLLTSTTKVMKSVQMDSIQPLKVADIDETSSIITPSQRNKNTVKIYETMTPDFLELEVIDVGEGNSSSEKVNSEIENKNEVFGKYCNEKVCKEKETNTPRVKETCELKKGHTFEKSTETDDTLDSQQNTSNEISSQETEHCIVDSHGINLNNGMNIEEHTEVVENNVNIVAQGEVFAAEDPSIETKGGEKDKEYVEPKEVISCIEKIDVQTSPEAQKKRQESMHVEQGSRETEKDCQKESYSEPDFENSLERDEEAGMNVGKDFDDSEEDSQCGIDVGVEAQDVRDVPQHVEKLVHKDPTYNNKLAQENFSEDQGTRLEDKAASEEQSSEERHEKIGTFEQINKTQHNAPEEVIIQPKEHQFLLNSTSMTTEREKESFLPSAFSKQEEVEMLKDQLKPKVSENGILDSKSNEKTTQGNHRPNRRPPKSLTTKKEDLIDHLKKSKRIHSKRVSKKEKGVTRDKCNADNNLPQNEMNNMTSVSKEKCNNIQNHSEISCLSETYESENNTDEHHASNNSTSPEASDERIENEPVEKSFNKSELKDGLEISSTLNKVKHVFDTRNESCMDSDHNTSSISPHRLSEEDCRNEPTVENNAFNQSQLNGTVSMGNWDDPNYSLCFTIPSSQDTSFEQCLEMSKREKELKNNSRNQITCHDTSGNGTVDNDDPNTSLVFAIPTSDYKAFEKCLEKSKQEEDELRIKKLLKCRKKSSDIFNEPKKSNESPKLEKLYNEIRNHKIRSYKRKSDVGNAKYKLNNSYQHIGSVKKVSLDTNRKSFGELTFIGGKSDIDTRGKIKDTSVDIFHSSKVHMNSLVDSNTLVNTDSTTVCKSDTTTLFTADTTAPLKMLLNESQSLYERRQSSSSNNNVDESSDSNEDIALSDRLSRKRRLEGDGDGSIQPFTKKQERSWKKHEKSKLVKCGPEPDDIVNTDSLDAKSIEVTVEIHNEPEENVTHSSFDVNKWQTVQSSSTEETDTISHEKDKVSLTSLKSHGKVHKKVGTKNPEKTSISKICEDIRKEIIKEKYSRMKMSQKEHLNSNIIQPEPIKRQRGRPRKHPIDYEKPPNNSSDHFLFKHSRKRKRKRSRFDKNSEPYLPQDKLNVSIELNHLDQDEQLRNILSKNNKCSEHISYPENQQRVSKSNDHNGSPSKYNTGSPICIKLKSDTSDHGNKNKRYKSYFIQESSIVECEVEGTHVEELSNSVDSLDSIKKKKRKSVDTETIPLLSFENFDKSDDNEDKMTAFDKQDRDRRASTLSTPRNSVEYNSEDETVETIEKFISAFPSTRESNKKESDNCTHQIALENNETQRDESNVKDIGSQNETTYSNSSKQEKYGEQNVQQNPVNSIMYNSTFEQTYPHEEVHMESN